MSVCTITHLHIYECACLLTFELMSGCMHACMCVCGGEREHLGWLGAKIATPMIYKSVTREVPINTYFTLLILENDTGF